MVKTNDDNGDQGYDDDCVDHIVMTLILAATSKYNIFGKLTLFGGVFFGRYFGQKLPPKKKVPPEPSGKGITGKD